MSAGPLQKKGVIVLKGDASNFKPRPASPETQKLLAEIREKLRLYAPEEYEAMMKEREEYLKQRQLEQKPPENNDKQ